MVLSLDHLSRRQIVRAHVRELLGIATKLLSSHGHKRGERRERM